MTRLLLRLEQTFPQEPMPLGAVAKVAWVAHLDGSPPKHWWKDEKYIGMGTTPSTTFDLPNGGIYSVDVIRPRGPVISNEFRVEVGQTREETIELRAPAPVELRGTLVVKKPRGTLRLGPKVAFSGCDLLGLPTLNLSWHNARRYVEYDVNSVRKTAASSAFDPPPIYTLRDDGRYVSWDMEALDATKLAALRSWETDKSAPGDPSRIPPRWMMVSVDGSVHLVAVPWTWWLEPPVPPLPIQILHDRRPLSVGRRPDFGGRSSVRVRDDKWFPLLEYLASGRLFEAGKIADQFVEDDLINAMYLKQKGPLLAVAGAIILIARKVSTEWQIWDSWLDNLSNLFPHIPDGQILRGYRRLQQAKDAGQYTIAKDYLTEGYSRGVPLMSATVRMLSLALAQISNDYEDAKDMRHDVTFIAARVDPDQPFTVIRS